MKKKQYYRTKLAKLAKGLDEPSPILPYPTGEDGRILHRRKDFNIYPSKEALSETHPGAMDWAANEMFAGREELVRWMETIVAGDMGDPALLERLKKFCLLYRVWQRLHAIGELDEAPTLNQVCYGLKLKAPEMVNVVAEAVRQYYKTVGRTKASFYMPEVIASAMRAAMMPQGGKDREFLARIAGVDEPAAGLQVNVNQTNTTAVQLNAGERERLKTPLLQFQQTVEDVDEAVRNAVDVEAEDVQP